MTANFIKKFITTFLEKQMPSKYCAACDELVSTANFVPDYCGWCGKDLRNEPLFPEFSTYKERVEL